jgi:hypothetical protein
MPQRHGVSNTHAKAHSPVAAHVPATEPSTPVIGL